MHITFPYYVVTLYIADIPYDIFSALFDFNKQLSHTDAVPLCVRVHVFVYIQFVHLKY